MSGHTPQFPQEVGNHEILFSLGAPSQGCAGQAPFKQHGILFDVRLEDQNGWIAGPEQQALQFVFGFHVRQSHLQDSRCAVGPKTRRHPGTAHFFFHGWAKGQGPPLAKIKNGIGESGEPVNPPRYVATMRRYSFRDVNISHAMRLRTSRPS